MAAGVPAPATACPLRVTDVLHPEAEPPGLRVELLWFQDCPNHRAVRAMLGELIDELTPGTKLEDVDATDPVVAERHRFPGSPTVRVDGRDVDPSFEDPGDYTPRCRLYWTAEGLRGLPERRWVEEALRRAVNANAP